MVTLDGAQLLLVVPIVVDGIQEVNHLTISWEGLIHLCFLWLGREPSTSLKSLRVKEKGSKVEWSFREGMNPEIYS